MELTRYIVALKDGASKLEILDALGRDTSIDETVNSNEIPDRAVEMSEFEHKRPASKRIFEVDLTEEEFDILYNHPDVIEIDEPSEYEDVGQELLVQRAVSYTHLTLPPLYSV